MFITLQVSGWKQFGEQSTHPKFHSVFHNISILFGKKESINCRIQSGWSAPAWSAMATVMTPPVDLRPWEEVHPRRLRQLKGPQNSARASVTNNTFHRKVRYAQFWGSAGLACFGCSFCWSARKTPRYHFKHCAKKTIFEFRCTKPFLLKWQFLKAFLSTNWVTAVARHFQQEWLRICHVEYIHRLSAHENRHGASFCETTNLQKTFHSHGNLERIHRIHILLNGLIR